MDYIKELGIVTSANFWLGNIISLIFANAIFFVRLRRRKHFIPRLVLSVVGYIAVYIFLSPVVVNYIFISMSWILAFVLSVICGCVCFKHRFIDILFCVICAFATQNSINIIVELIGYAATGADFIGAAYVSAYLLSMAVLLTVTYFLVAKKIKKNADIIVKNNYMIIVAATVMLCGSIGYLNYLPYDTVTRNWLTRLFRIGINIIVIMLMMSYRTNKDLIDEKKVMQTIIAKENDQFKSMREYMEVIDIKCHDLKKLLNSSNLDEGVNKEIACELVQSAEEYRNMPKTGIAALDVVLYDKIIICKKNDTTMTYMINGEDLNKLKAVDVATIFNNLLYNAIEYLRDIDDKEKRLISLNIQSRYNCVFITVENYCESDISFRNGLPVTTKGSNHGFGLKSVKYTVEHYGGTVNVVRKDNIFSVDIVIPVQD